ncbi:hypothetical protein ABZ851_36910 [Streptomyces sp. NPDC047049]|uniref:hypothetical protein n=1 Tax=Streptomyces sp. NPDC047049 TaxID=3156688 RepID=UPI00340579F1
MTQPPEEYPDPFAEAMRRGAARTMAVLAQAAETAVLVAAIRERQATRRAVEEAQRERARKAAEDLRRQTDRVRWQRALDDEWLEAATVDELVTAWVAGRTHMHEDAMAHDAVERLEKALVEREPQAMDLYQRLMGAPYEPEEAMRQAAEWFTRQADAEAIAKKTPAERTARVSRGELDPGPEVVAASQRDDLRQAVAVALPDLADQITGDPAWPALAATMATAEQQGLDPARALATVAAERELNTARGMTAVLQWRLERHLENPPPNPADNPAAADPATGATPTATAAATAAGGTSRRDEVRRAIRDVGRSRRMTEGGSEEERRAFVLERWRIVHAAEDELPGAQRAARAFERELIELDPEARAMYRRLAPVREGGGELIAAEREQDRKAVRAAFEDYLIRHDLTEDGTPTANATQTQPAQQQNQAPRQDQAAAPADEGTVLYRWEITIPSENGVTAHIADGQFRVPAGPDQRAAAERMAEDELRALFKVEAERMRPVPENRQRDYVIHAVGPGGHEEHIRVTGRTLHHHGDRDAAPTPPPRREPASHQVPAEPAPAPQPSPAPPQQVPDGVQAEAENAARMARMASAGPVDAALPQQKAERPAVSGKVVRHQGQDLTSRRGGPRPGR